MGEKAKVILNEYSARDLLHKGTINPDKFYTSDLKLIIEIAQKEIKKLDNVIRETINLVENSSGNYKNAIGETVKMISSKKVLSSLGGKE
ncbi:MAG: hypothetical protein IJV31_08045 [Clostridia bacterium]|nr:hypothetical protein [Clostridia bacterium]